MKNYVQEGKNVTVIAPADVVGGQGLLVGSLFGVVGKDAKSGEEVEVATVGVYELPKTTAQAWASAFAAIYWDNTAKKLSTTSAGNTKIGINMVVQGANDAFARVRLNGVF
jgi:predicted RecA/RadA family phage recombinase